MADPVSIPVSRRGPRVWLPALLWIATFIIARAGLEPPSLATPWRVGFAILPVPFFIWFLIAFVQAQRASDELERRIQLEALAVAFPLTMVLIMTLGLLEL